MWLMDSLNVMSELKPIILGIAIRQHMTQLANNTRQMINLRGENDRLSQQKELQASQMNDLRRENGCLSQLGTGHEIKHDKSITSFSLSENDENSSAISDKI